MKSRTSTSRTAWLAILAIMWHALLPLAHAANSAASAPQGVLSTICTTGTPGLELIKLPANSPDAAKVDLLNQCPLCASGAHAILFDVTTRAFVPDARLAHVHSPVAFLLATHVSAWLNFSPRAPPMRA
ncbi:MAG TPA: DUF2946 family protein [Rhodocyclaceae bacterium]|nr:DUF2946 family protein [Rhodocyclaceae bacterium]